MIIRCKMFIEIAKKNTASGLAVFFNGSEDLKMGIHRH